MDIFHWTNLLPMLALLAACSCWWVAGSPRFETGVLMTWGLAVSGFGFAAVCIKYYEGAYDNVERMGAAFTAVAAGVAMAGAGAVWKAARGKRRMQDWVGIDRRRARPPVSVFKMHK